MKKLLSIVTCVSLLSFSISSCDLIDDLFDDNGITPDAIGDAFIKQIIVNDTVVYGLALYAYSNVEIGTALVTPFDQTTVISLEQYNSLSTIFRNYPTEESDFSQTVPAEGEYTFIVTTSLGEVLVRTDFLTDELVDALEIDSISVSMDNIYVNWNKPENADKYLVRLYNSDDVMIFASHYLPNFITEAGISNFTHGWRYSSQNISNVKTLKVTAIKFESSEIFNEHYIQSTSEEIRNIVIQ
jgi:uncharacterized protein YaiI (UPF0178 family)